MPNADDEMLTWLRATIEGSKAAAEAVRQPDGSPTVAPWTSYAHPPGMGNRYQDRDVILVGAEPERDGESWLVCEAGQWPGARAVADHIALQQPQDTIARCEADLLLLDEHHCKDGDCSSCGRASWEENPGGHLRDEPEMVDVWRPAFWPCRTVRTLAFGYRRRPGWNPDWAPSE